MADKNKAGDFYTRPEKLGALAGCSQFMWNGDTKQFMGRTSSSWGKILLFYFIFYAVLAAFFMAMWFIFASTLVTAHPKYELSESIIGTNPGLGFRPMPPESNVESTLIWFEESKDNTKYWVDETKNFLSGFNETTVSDHAIDCRRYDRVNAEDHCKVSFEKFGDCTEKNGYGYEKGKPCIFLKLNKIYNWEPEYYDNYNDLPEKMPQSLKTHIKDYSKKDSKLQVVWVSCEGENPADIDNLGKEVTFKSLNGEQGFLGKYFPFRSTPGYLQPLVAVQFADVTRSVLINIECKAWAKNIKHDRADRRGSVHFELMIDAVKKN